MSLLFERGEELTTLDKDISFQIIDWFVPESDKIDYDFTNNVEEAREYSVNIYGKTKDGISVCAKVVEFEPYFYIKPPEEWELFDDKKFKQEVKNNNNVQINTVKVVPIIRVEFYNECK